MMTPPLSINMSAVVFTRIDSTSTYASALAMALVVGLESDCKIIVDPVFCPGQLG